MQIQPKESWSTYVNMRLTDDRRKYFTRDKRGHLIIKLVQIHQENMITNIIATNKRAPKTHETKTITKRSVQSLGHVRLFGTTRTTVCQSSLSIANSRSLLKLMSIKQVISSSHLILCCPFLLLSSIFPSIRVFSNESVLHIRWPEYWNFSLSLSPSNEYSGLTSFRTDWFDLLAVQGTYKSLLQHHSSEASILRHSTVCKLRDVQAGFRKARGTRDQIANIHCIIENSIPEKHLFLLY